MPCIAVQYSRDLDIFEECVWAEIPTRDGVKLLLGNHYFTPDLKPEIIF
jgi:hypothetical protein